MIPKLPHKVTDNAETLARQKRLEAKKEKYVFAHPEVIEVPRVQKVPPEESFDVSYDPFQWRIGKIIANAGAVGVGGLFDPFDELQDYADLYPALGIPFSGVDELWRSDNYFAFQRLGGMNPVVITRLRSRQSLPEDCDITAEHVSRVIGKTLDEAIETRHLFICDYEKLIGHVWGGNKRVHAPIALFFWERTGVDEGRLIPVAIQLTRGSGDHRIFTPADDRATWLIAKTHLQVAEANLHEMDTHLIRSHLSMEPFKVAMERHLSDAHPLHVLLTPHFRFLLAINEEARTRLLATDGPVDLAMAGTLSATMGLAQKAYEEWSFWKRARLPTELETRSVHDPVTLPLYPYRDDGLLIWNAIRQFVKRYVDLYYLTEDDIHNDKELLQFVDELGSSSGGRVAGLTPDGPAIKSRETLVEVVSGIIWTAGPHHAAVNFSQWDIGGFVPNLPFAAYHEPPSIGDTADALDLQKTLPPFDMTMKQIETMFFLGTYRYDRLGHYPPGHFEDPNAVNLVAELQSSLTEAQETIQQRNATRQFAYEFLLPINIPNSTSV